MISFITQETYEAICRQWTHILLLNAESQVHVWPPLSCAYAVLNKFAHDTNLQEKLFENKKHKLIFIDGYEAIHPTWEEFEYQFFYSLPDHQASISMDEYLESHKDTIFGIFLVGYDNAIKHENTTILKHIGALLEKHDHLSVILITEQNIADSPLYQDLIQKHMLVENIFYQKLYQEHDIRAILKHLEKSWGFTISEDVKKYLLETVGGHPMLLEEAARIIRENPTITPQELLNHHHLVRKALTIFKSLHETDQEAVKHLLANKTHAQSEYLQETGLIENGKLQFPYWQYIYDNFPEEEVFHGTNHQPIDIIHTLTHKEHDIYNQLTANPGKVFNREEIAKLIWGNSWEDKYSDWAIDQTMHRLREKLAQYQSEYVVKTKKGEGFILITK